MTSSLTFSFSYCMISSLPLTSSSQTDSRVSHLFIAAQHISLQFSTASTDQVGWRVNTQVWKQLQNAAVNAPQHNAQYFAYLVQPCVPLSSCIILLIFFFLFFSIFFMVFSLFLLSLHCIVFCGCSNGCLAPLASQTINCIHSLQFILMTLLSQSGVRITVSWMYCMCVHSMNCLNYGYIDWMWPH